MVAGQWLPGRLNNSKINSTLTDLNKYTWHHDQQANVQISFMKYLHSMVRHIDGVGNTYEEESQTCLS